VRGAGMDQDIKVAHRMNNDRNNTAIVSVSTSFKLPMPLRATFDQLRNNMLRPEVRQGRFSDLPLQSQTLHGQFSSLCSKPCTHVMCTLHSGMCW
jgi:hypothetical protein